MGYKVEVWVVEIVGRDTADGVFVYDDEQAAKAAHDGYRDSLDEEHVEIWDMMGCQ